MIYAPLSNFVRSIDEPVSVSATITADGQALVGATQANGLYGVGPSTGAAGERFVGFVRAQTSMVPYQQATAVKVETLALNASGVTVLGLAPVSGTLSVYNKTAGAAVAGGNVALAGDGVTMTVTGAPGATVEATYTYAMTVTQFRARFGDVQPGGYAGAQVGQVGVGKQGLIYIDQFDTATDWRAVTAVRLGANGKVTGRGNGTVINAVVRHVPSDNYPYLGLDFIAPN